MEQNENDSKVMIWRERLKDLSASGLSQKEWCRQQDISIYTLQYWKKKLQEEPSESKENTWMTVVPDSTDYHAATDSEITIRKSGITIVLSSTVDPRISHELLQVLMRQ